MLVQTDINELGDKRLDPKENVAREREKCLALAAQKRLPHQEDIEDPKRALGPRLQFSEFVSRLRRIVPALKVLDGSPGNLALYFPRNRKELQEATQAWDGSRDVFFLRHKYVGGFAKTELQEYSTVDIDNAMLPTKEHRGWRSVLMNLILQSVVGYKDAVREFGDTGTDQRGWRWRSELQSFKN
jgi:hypothetical protein